MSTRDCISKALLFAVLLLLPAVAQSNYHFHLLILICIYSTLSISLNLIVGHAGQASLCHGALFGLGAYTSALLSTRLGTPAPVAFILGGLLAAALALPIGLPSLRFKGVYFAVATLGFQQIVNLLTVNMIWLTRGPMGITDIPPFAFAGKPFTMSHYYYAGLALAAATYYIVALLIKSRTGLELGAIQGDETTARTLGIDTYRLKVASFSVSALFAGLAGGFFAHYLGFVSPNSFTINLSVTAFTMVLAGGKGTLSGPVYGAILLTIIPEYLRSLQNYQMLAYGLALVILIVFFPTGISGVWKRAAVRVQRQVACR